MGLYLKSSKSMKIMFFICISFFLLTSLTGFRDIKKEGVECRFRARIVDIEKPPPDQKVLVVKQILRTQTKAQEKQQKIYVLVTGETIIGSGNSILKFEDLRLEMAIEIQGLKIIEKEDGEEDTVVLAKRIRPLVQ
jgi:hypothetical protein